MLADLDLLLIAGVLVRNAAQLRDVSWPGTGLSGEAHTVTKWMRNVTRRSWRIEAAHLHRVWALAVTSSATVDRDATGRALPNVARWLGPVGVSVKERDAVSSQRCPPALSY